MRVIVSTEGSGSSGEVPLQLLRIHANVVRKRFGWFYVEMFRMQLQE